MHVPSKDRKPRESDKVGKNRTKWEEKGDNRRDCYKEWRRRSFICILQRGGRACTTASIKSP